MTRPAQRCAAAMLETIPAAMRIIRRHMRSHRLPGMSVPQFRVLAFLDRSGPATLSAAAEHVGTTLPSMSRMLQSLVDSRLVRRRRGVTDRRTVGLEITARGHRVLTIARKATIAQLTGQLEALRAGDLGRLEQAMGLLRRVVVDEKLRAAT